MYFTPLHLYNLYTRVVCGYVAGDKGIGGTRAGIRNVDSQSDMVRYMFKDPYLLDFTGAEAHSRERDVEDSLTQHITKFLLELKQGFSFVGRQVQMTMLKEMHNNKIII